MNQRATVVEATDTYAIVEVVRTSACAGCHKNQGDGCAVCSLTGRGKPVRARAENALGAQVGDIVEVETPSGRVLLYAALVFLLPLVLALAGYMIAAQLTENTLIPYLISLGAFVLTFVGLYIGFERHKKAVPDIRITAIVKE